MIYAPLPSLLALRSIVVGIEPAAKAARRMQSVQRRTPRVQNVRRVRHFLRQALQGADGGRGAQEGRGEFLRSLQAQSRRLYRQKHHRVGASQIGVGRAISQVTLVLGYPG